MSSTPDHPSLTNKLSVSGMLGIFIGLCGILLSIYFYYEQKQFKGLSFVTSPEPTLLFSTSQLTPAKLTLLDEKENPVNGDVYSLEAFIWNSGTETLVHQDIVAPLELSFSEGVSILDFRTLYASRPEVTEISASRLDDQDKLNIRFRVLEPGEGMRLVFIYQGSEDISATFKGGVIGIKHISDRKRIVEDNKWSAPWKYYQPVAYLLALVLASVSIPLLLYVTVKKVFPEYYDRIALWLFLIFFSAVMVIYAAMLFRNLIHPWWNPEKIVEDSILDYVPKQIAPGYRANSSQY